MGWCRPIYLQFSNSVNGAHFSECCLHHKNGHFPNSGASERHTYRFHELQDGTMHDQMMTLSSFNITALVLITFPKLFLFVYINCCHVQFNSNQPKLQPQSSNLHQLVESWFLRKQIRSLMYCSLVWPHSHGMLHTCALFLLTEGRFTRNLPKQLRARKKQKSARTSRCKRRVFPEPLATGQF